MVATIQEIKKAKEIGKFLRTARQEQGLNLTSLAHKTGMPISQLLALENANFYTFINNPEEMYERAQTFAQALGIDISTNVCTRHSSSTVSAKSDIFIPYFLRKKE